MLSMLLRSILLLCLLSPLPAAAASLSVRGSVESALGTDVGVILSDLVVVEIDFDAQVPASSGPGASFDDAIQLLSIAVPDAGIDLFASGTQVNNISLLDDSSGTSDNVTFSVLGGVGGTVMLGSAVVEQIAVSLTEVDFSQTPDLIVGAQALPEVIDLETGGNLTLTVSLGLSGGGFVSLAIGEPTAVPEPVAGALGVAAVCSLVALRRQRVGAR